MRNIVHLDQFKFHTVIPFSSEGISVCGVLLVFKCSHYISAGCCK